METAQGTDSTRVHGCVCGRLTTAGQLRCPVHDVKKEEDPPAIDPLWFMQHTRLESEALARIAVEMARANEIALKRLELETAKLNLAVGDAKRNRESLERAVKLGMDLSRHRPGGGDGT